MHKIWLRTFVALVILIVGLSSHGVAQTFGQRTPFNERYREVKNPLATAKAAAARAVRSNGAVTVPRSKPAGTFLTFDAPGASNSKYNGTFPTAVSDSGVIAGYYNDAKSLSHGLLRAPNGAFITFDVPGAVNGTFPSGVNNDGAIAGGYGDNVGSGFHSFVRDRNGTIFTFDPPVKNLFSQAAAINWDWTSTGFYSDENSILHGFLRTRGGKIITFDAPGATGPIGTFPFGITANGWILGTYSHTNGTTFKKGYEFGFLMTAFGTSTAITGPGGLGGQSDPFNPGPAFSINRSGQIAGTYFEPISNNPFGGNYRVFVRSRDGTYVTFDAANYPPCCIWSAPSGMNFAGTITGSFNDGFNINHGFWRTRDGTVTTFDFPGAGTGFNQGTLPLGITAAGVIAGSYSDANNVTHGFLFRPNCFTR